MIKILLEIASHEPSPIFLSGNHEVGLLAFLSGRLSFLEYAWMGGLYTIQSYVGKATENVRAELITAMPQSHYEFLSNCKPFFETDLRGDAGETSDVDIRLVVLQSSRIRYSGMQRRYLDKAPDCNEA